MLTLLWAVIVGFVVGSIAKFIMPGRQPAGFIVTTLLGIGGSVIGTYLGQLLHLYHDGEKAGFIFSLIGAIIILFIYQKLFRDPTP
ncbi:MAG: GlsB/YeaQ/YmgE family stress response membrane protein [Commensalibacter sp.]